MAGEGSRPPLSSADTTICCTPARVVTSRCVNPASCRDCAAPRLLREAGSGLQPAGRAGCHVAASWWPSAGVAVVPADLPCLSSRAVTQVLQLGQRGDGASVPDRALTGTTVVVCPAGRPMAAQYGPGSAAEHRDLGRRSLEDAPLRARHDVDTLADLWAAATVGLGARTVAQVAALERQGPLTT